MGDYVVRARVADTDNLSFTYAYADFKVTPVHVTFTNLKQRGWMVGTPVDQTPDPICTVTPAWVLPIYEYAAQGSEDWSAEKPTAVGSYRVRVRAANETDYSFEIQYADFSIVGGLGDIFSDYV